MGQPAAEEKSKSESLLVQTGAGKVPLRLLLRPLATSIGVRVGASAPYVMCMVMDPGQMTGVDSKQLETFLGLSKAESAVVSHLSAGLAPDQIAEKLFVSLHTVRSHLKSAYAKTGTSGQGELVALAVRCGE